MLRGQAVNDLPKLSRLYETKTDVETNDARLQRSYLWTSHRVNFSNCAQRAA
jgi:hypothetical protein